MVKSSDKESAPSTAANKKPSQRKSPPSRPRMQRDSREQQIIEGATKYFAEVGFNGDTRNLASALGVTQPLLFKYFKNKDALIERVFRELCLSRWNPDWELLIADRSRPLKERMIELYNNYASVILSYEWVRIFLFSRFKGLELSVLYLKWMRERIHKPLVIELRKEFDLPSRDEVPINELEIEILRTLNEKIFYVGIRKWVYGLPITLSIESIVDAEVEIFFSGAKVAMSKILLKPTVTKKAGSKPRKKTPSVLDGS